MEDGSEATAVTYVTGVIVEKVSARAIVSLAKF